MAKTVTEIANTLTLSTKTSTHRANNLNKLDLQNNTELMRYAVDHDLTIF